MVASGHVTWMTSPQCVYRHLPGGEQECVPWLCWLLARKNQTPYLPAQTLSYPMLVSSGKAQGLWNPNLPLLSRPWIN